MQCPRCKEEDTQIIDSRINEQKNIVRRRRECKKCGYRFTTFEKPAITSMVVIKKDGNTELYDRDKVIESIVIATKKRNISLEVLENKIMELEEKWIAKKSITTKEIGDDILNMLKELDDVAYIRFASVYKNFQTIDEFLNEINNTKK